MPNTDNQLWQDALRRAENDPSESNMVALLIQVRDGQVNLINRIDAVEAHNKERDLKMDAILKAFPGGDIEGHRRYHDLMIEKIEETRRLRKAITEKTIAGLVWAGVLWIATACGHELAAAIARAFSSKGP